MKKSFFLCAIAALAMGVITSCGSKNTAEAAPETQAITVDSVLVNAEALATSGDTVYVEGVVSHLCKHGGRKAFLLGTNDSTMIRCESTPEMGGAFPQESIHKAMLVKGVVVESRLTEEDVQAIEAQHAQQVKMVAEQAGAEQAAAMENATTGCDTERKAQGQGDIDSFQAQMADYRARIAARAEKEGKPYLSSYYILTTSYEILPE